MSLCPCAANYAPFHLATLQGQPLGSAPSIPLRADQLSDRDTEKTTEIVAGTVRGASGSVPERGSSDAPSIVPGDVPPAGSSNVPQAVLEETSLNVLRPMAPSAPSGLVLDAPSANPPSVLGHVPPTVRSEAIMPSIPAPVPCVDPPSSSVPSTGSSHIQAAVPSGVPSSVAPHGSSVAPIWSTIQSDIPSTVPSFSGVPGPRPPSTSSNVSSAGFSAVQAAVLSAVLPAVSLSGPPATATSQVAYPTVASEGSRGLIPAEQSPFDSLSGPSSNTLWSFPQDYTPAFSSNGFAAARLEALDDNSWGVQQGDNTGIEANGDWNVMLGETGVEASSPSQASAIDAWDQAGSRLSADSDAYEDMGFEDDLKAVGRPSDANLSILKQEFIEVQKRAKAVAEETGMSPAQVLQYWSTASTRTHSKRNMWNLYGAYFRENEEQELSRLSERKSAALGC